jgi:hypothetical protein
VLERHFHGPDCRHSIRGSREQAKGLGRCVDAALPFFGGHLDGFGSAEFFKAREVPSVRKIAALVRLDRLDPTVPSRIQKAAGPVGLIQKDLSVALEIESGVALDELRFGELQVGGDARDIGLGPAHQAGSAATGGASIAFPEDRHRQSVIPGMTRCGGAFTKEASRR